MNNYREEQSKYKKHGILFKPVISHSNSSFFPQIVKFQFQNNGYNDKNVDFYKNGDFYTSNIKFNSDSNLSDEIMNDYQESTSTYSYTNEDNEEMNMIQSNFLTALDLPFIKEAQDLLLNIFKNSMDYDQISLEFICFKNSENPENIDCAIAIILAISKYWQTNDLKKGIDLLQPLLRAFLPDEDNQEDFLFWWQEYCAKSNEKVNVFVNVLNLLDELDILSYQSFDNWEQQQDECDKMQTHLFTNYK